MNDRNFKGIWIPREIWLEPNLTLQEKVFYVEIDSLNNERGCYANNQYFADFFGLSTVRVSEIINSLVRKGYISSEIDQANGNRRTMRTLLKLSLRPSQRKVDDPLKDSFIHNNKENNTPTYLGRSGIKRNQIPLNASLDLELNTWLGAVAVAVGAKDAASLSKYTKWERVCMTAIREQRGLEKLLAVIEAEKLRNKGQEEFFSPDTVLQKLQLAGNKKTSKWMHDL